MTELRGKQDQAEACNVRLKYHIEHPKECMATGVVSTFKIEPEGAVLAKRNCLAQEAIYSAKALGRDATARGACFSCSKLGAALQNTAQKVRGAIRGLDGQAARDAVLQYAAGLDEDHPLCRHLAGFPFKGTMYCKADLPVKVQSGRSGKPGHLTREQQLGKGEYADGSTRHRRLKRGVDPSGNVHAEDSRRSVRRSGLQKRPSAQH